MEVINEAGAQPLSDTVRRALEQQLGALLQNRQRMLEGWKRCTTDAFGYMAMLEQTESRCADLCADLGFGSEVEAAAMLLRAEAVNQVAGEPQRVEVTFNGDMFVERPVPPVDAPEEGSYP